MKKMMIILALTVLTGMVYGQEVKASLGLNGAVALNNRNFNESGTIQGYSYKINTDVNTSLFSVGAFFDLTYVEARVA